MTHYMAEYKFKQDTKRKEFNSMNENQANCLKQLKSSSSSLLTICKISNKKVCEQKRNTYQKLKGDAVLQISQALETYIFF